MAELLVAGEGETPSPSQYVDLRPSVSDPTTTTLAPITTPSSPVLSVPTSSAPVVGSAKTLKAQSQRNVNDRYQDVVAALEAITAATGVQHRLNGDFIEKEDATGTGTGGSAYGLGPVATSSSTDGDWVKVGGELQKLADRYKKAKADDTLIDENISNGLYQYTGEDPAGGGSGGGSGGGGGRGGGAGGGGGGTLTAAEAYLESEQLKTKEITRQYNDFAARADELYQLLAAEQQANMRADDQNAQNAKTMAETGIIQPWYGHQTLGNNPLSELLRPSLPDYVRPDYRLNQAVGLPGEQGFDDPQYDESGFPAFAFGTSPWVPLNPKFRLRAPIGAAPWERR